MKRKLFITLVSMIALLGLTACSADSPKSSKSVESTEQTSSTKSFKKAKETSSIKNTETSSEVAKSKMGNDPKFSLMIEAARSQLPAVKEQTGNAYKDITIEEGKDNTIIYNYTLTQKPETKVDGEALKPTLVKGLKPQMDRLKGYFPDVKIQVNYLDPDGTTIASITITPEDTNTIEE